MAHRRAVLGSLVSFALLAGCSSAGPDDDTAPPSSSASATTSALPVSTAELPAPPALMPLAGLPGEQAAALADAFEKRDETRASALLAAFAAAGVPVVGADERSLTTPDDTIGVPWVLAYTAATAPSPDARVPLSQVALMFAADGIEPALDTAAVGADLVAGLRTALAGDPAVPGPTPIALLVQEEARRARGVDLADPAVTADQVFVTVPTATLLVATGILAVVAPADGAGPVGNVAGAHRARSAALPSQLPDGCATDSAGQWALWIASKVAAGTDIPGIGSWDGMFVGLLNHVATLYPPGQIPAGLTQLRNGLGKVGTVAGLAAAALTLTSLVAGLLTASAEVDLERGEPLIRTKSASQDGETRTIAVKVSFDYGTLDKSTVDGINCLLSVLVVMGNNSTLPNPGKVEGVKVTIGGLEGFGQGLVTQGSYVLLSMPLSADTDSSGTAKFTVIGRAQRNQIPESAPPYDRWFTVSVAAQQEPTDLETLSKLFLDSFLCAGGALAGKFVACADPLADILKQFQWDLGTKRFRLVDWVNDLKLDGTFLGYHWTATKCGGATGIWNFTITNLRDLPATGSFTLERDPVPGEPPVAVTTTLVRFEDATVGVAYEESFLLTFYGDGADTSWGAPPGSPAMGIDEVLGPGGIPVLVGNFC